MDKVRALGEIVVSVYRRSDPLSTDGDIPWKQAGSQDSISEKAMKGRALTHKAKCVSSGRKLMFCANS